jgi:hypothetical protein
MTTILLGLLMMFAGAVVLVATAVIYLDERRHWL